MSSPDPNSPNVPSSLLWLSDAPMFIDDEQISRFYDAVVRPANRKGATTLQVSKQNSEKVTKKLGWSAKFGLGGLLSALGIVTAEVTPSGERAKEKGTTTGDTETVVLEPIRTPQRQLLQLSAHYLVMNPDRLFAVENVADRPADPVDQWWANATIGAVPRALAFINLPSLAEVEESKKKAARDPKKQLKPLPITKLIPVAAEFTNGTVVTYFDKVRPKAGMQACPDHPDIRQPADKYQDMKRAYWKWYVDNFEIQPSIELVEKSVQEQKCRIQWIDFRVPISDEGDTLHLHIAGGGRYDTTTFGYNFIRRGYEFGLRLIGTLKTDPDLNVLAIYER